MIFNYTDNEKVDLCKLGFKLVLWLSFVIECLNSQDCQLPVKPIYGGCRVEGDKVTYSCRKGYGIVGSATRYCKNGSWLDTAPICVKAASPVVNDELSKYLTDNNATTCVSVTGRIFQLISSSISLKFSFDRTVSRAIIRIIMTVYTFGIERPIFINGKPCHHIEETNVLKNNIVVYDYHCSLVHTHRNKVEIRIYRNKRSVVCEIQMLPIKKIACPLLELSIVNASITFDPKVSGNTAKYGTAAIYSCNGNETLRGSEVRYCIDGNQWSGSEAFCGERSEEHGKTAIVVKYFIVIVSSAVVAGFVVIVIIISVCIIRRKKRVKPSLSQDIQRGPSRISMIDHYYNTANYDYAENGIRTTTDHEDYDYCTVDETATIGASTNWKFAQFTIRKPSSPVTLLDNETYLGN